MYECSISKPRNKNSQHLPFASIRKLPTREVTSGIAEKKKTEGERSLVRCMARFPKFRNGYNFIIFSLFFPFATIRILPTPEVTSGKTEKKKYILSANPRKSGAREGFQVSNWI